MDQLDDIANIEQRAYDEGVDAGKIAATSSDMRDAGVMSGIVKGYELGLELGFMKIEENCASNEILGIRATDGEEVGHQESPSVKGSDGLDDVTPERGDDIELANNDTLYKFVPQQSSKSSSSRIEKRRVKLAERIAQVPEENDREFDFKGELDSIRALYRLCNPPAGSLVREESSVKEKLTGNIETW